MEEKKIPVTWSESWTHINSYANFIEWEKIFSWAALKKKKKGNNERSDDGIETKLGAGD